MAGADHVIHDFGAMRVINNGCGPFQGNNIIVQINTGDGWRDCESYNSLNDDYAYTNARDAAQRRARANANPGP